MSITVVSSDKVYASIDDLPENMGISDGDRFLVQTEDGTVLVDFENISIDIEHTTFGDVITDLQEFQSIATTFITTITDEFNATQSDVSLMRTDVDTLQSQVDSIKLLLQLMMGLKDGESEESIDLLKNDLGSDGQTYMNEVYGTIISDVDATFSLTSNNLMNVSSSVSSASTEIEDLKELVEDQNKKISDFQTTIENLPYYRVGDIKWTFTSTCPDGFLLLNGQSVSKTEYADLYAHLKAALNWSDGSSSTFDLPDMRGCYPRMANEELSTLWGGLMSPTGTPIEPAVPNVVANFVNMIGRSAEFSGSSLEMTYKSGNLGGYWKEYGCPQCYNYNINASLGSSVYKDDVSDVRPYTMVMYAYIKY